MTFVCEKIDSAERVAELQSLSLISPLTGDLWKASRWFVDRERRLYFVVFGGGGPEIPFVFGLANANGLLLEAHAREESTGEYHQKNIELIWKVSKVMIPKSSASAADLLLSQLREALTDYGSLGDTEATKSVKVELPSPKFV